MNCLMGVRVVAPRSLENSMAIQGATKLLFEDFITFHRFYTRKNIMFLILKRLSRICIHVLHSNL